MLPYQSDALLSNHGAQLLWEFLAKLFQLGRLQSRPNFHIRRTDFSLPDVVGQRLIEQRRILRDDTENLTESLLTVAANINAAKHDGPLIWVVQTWAEPYQSATNS